MVQQDVCQHTYWPQIRNDGLDTIEKCGTCGDIRPWTVSDYAQAIADGTGIELSKQREGTLRPREEP